MRGNNRNLGQNQPFQGGLGLGSNVAPPGPMKGPSQGGRQCPPGQEPGRDETGAQICKPAQANIAGNVPVINANRATTPTPGTKPEGY